jgi:hypothetical protein
MRCSDRYIIKGLKPEHFKCSLEYTEKITCSDCGEVLPNKLAMQIVNGRMFCKDCSPWYKQQAEEDRRALEEDFLRSPIKGGFVRRLILIPEKSAEADARLIEQDLLRDYKQQAEEDRLMLEQDMLRTSMQIAAMDEGYDRDYWD